MVCFMFSFQAHSVCSATFPRMYVCAEERCLVCSCGFTPQGEEECQRVAQYRKLCRYYQSWSSSICPPPRLCAEPRLLQGVDGAWIFYDVLKYHKVWCRTVHRKVQVGAQCGCTPQLFKVQELLNQFSAVQRYWAWLRWPCSS